MPNIWGTLVVAGLLAGGGGAVYYALNSDSGPSAAPAGHAAGKKAALSGSLTRRVSASEAQTAQSGPPKPTRVLEGDRAKVHENDYFIGKADAPITIIEYASLTCPHCAQFHNDVLPDVKKTLVETGKVRLVYRDFPLDRYALSASMLARCAGRDRYFGFLDVFFKGQSSWARSPDPLKALSQLARLGGMPQKDVDACLQNRKLQEEVLAQRLDANNRLQVRATPTLIINGNMYSGGLSFDQIKAVVESMLSKS